MQRETIEKLPMLLSYGDLLNMGFSKGMIQNIIYKTGETGVVMIGKKRMVQRDELLKWLDKQKISVEEDAPGDEKSVTGDTERRDKIF